MPKNQDTTSVKVNRIEKSMDRDKLRPKVGMKNHAFQTKSETEIRSIDRKHQASLYRGDS